MTVTMPKGGWVFKRVTTHPGEMLREEFMVPLGLSANQVALRTGMPVSRLTEILRERRGVTADTAIRLGKFFGTTPHFWLNLQSMYELSKAQVELGQRINKEVKPLTDAERIAA